MGWIFESDRCHWPLIQALPAQYSRSNTSLPNNTFLYEWAMWRGGVCTTLPLITQPCSLTHAAHCRLGTCSGKTPDSLRRLSLPRLPRVLTAIGYSATIAT